jgi:hypothetical protein
MLGMLAGDTLQTGPGRAYRDGSLGCVGCGAVLQEGPGYAFRDGSLGGQILTGPGSAINDGSLGQPPVRAIVRRPRVRDVRAAAQARRLHRALMRYQRPMRGLGLVSLSPDLLIGAAIGIGAVYFVMGRK